MGTKAKRRSIVIALCSILAVVAFAGRADAAKIKGTPDADILGGSNGKDKINGIAGNDLLIGRAGKDKIKAAGQGLILLGAGKDSGKNNGGDDFGVIIDDDGTPKDSLKGGPDRQNMFSADGARDKIDCGAGHDLAITDLEDSVKNCETVLNVDGELSEDGEQYRAGTNAADTIVGADTAGIQPEIEYILGKAGDDELMAGTVPSMSAFLLGGSGQDVLVASSVASVFTVLTDDDGTPGDTLIGGAGTTQIFSADGADDTITCGDGNDTVVADPGDTVTNPLACNSLDILPLP